MIYICIPAFDEAATIGLLLWKIRRVMGEFPRDYELLVLDDGSSDGTPDVLAPYARVLPLTLIRHERRQGYGASLERLVREAAARATHPRRDVVVTLQADFTEAPEDIPALVRRMEGGADVVEGVSPLADGRLPRTGRWAVRGIRWMLGRAPVLEDVRDPLTGFRAYRVSVLRKALAERPEGRLLERNGWAANVELLLAVLPFARRVEAVEVERREHLRQRATRFAAWDTVAQLWDVARRARRIPAPAEPEENAAA